MKRPRAVDTKGMRIDRLIAFYRTRRLRSRVGVSLGAAIAVAALSVAAVGAVNSFTPTTTETSSTFSTGVVRWVAPRDQGNAPIVPTPGGAANGAGGFNGISCPSANKCVAVGADGNLGGVVSTSENAGGTWSQGKLDANEPELNGVDCASAVFCVAVGDGVTARSSDGGATWTSSSVPTTNTTLLGVSCPNATLCVSVGVTSSPNGPFAGELLLSLDGGATWTVPNLPASFGALGSVDCPTSSFCVAVGSSIVVSNDGGKTWTSRTVDGGSGILRSVSCATATNCVAIGANPAVAQDPTAAAYEDVTSDGGKSWSSVTMPPGSATLDVLSCWNSGCDAAGSAFGGAPAQVLTSNGGLAWTANSSLASAASAFSSLSCVSATLCVFVGGNGKSPVTVSSANGLATTTSSVAEQVRAQKDATR